jgi:DNA polymerase-3 subunit epsilon
MNNKDQVIQWARKIISEGEKVLVLDTETTGLDGGAEVVQVAVVDLSGATVYETLVKPVGSIPARVTEIHGITNKMVANAPKFDQVHAHLMNLLGGKRVVIYNADYDTRLLYQSGRYYGGLPELVVSSWECAMQQYAVFCGEWDRRRRAYRWQRLPSGDHSARGDCVATVELIKKMAAAELSTERGNFK